MIIISFAVAFKGKVRNLGICFPPNRLALLLAPRDLFVLEMQAESSAANLFEVVSFLQHREGVRFHMKAGPVKSCQPSETG
jgi:hypothetical protein